MLIVLLMDLAKFSLIIFDAGFTELSTAFFTLTGNRQSTEIPLAAPGTDVTLFPGGGGAHTLAVHVLFELCFGHTEHLSDPHTGQLAVFYQLIDQLIIHPKKVCNFFQ